MMMVYKCLFIYTMVFDTSVSHVIVIVIDGINPRLLATALNPYFARPNCSRTLYAVTVFPACFPP
jgi:aspartate-semialdehyde dehydrogenase